MVSARRPGIVASATLLLPMLAYGRQRRLKA